MKKDNVFSIRYSETNIIGFLGFKTNRIDNESAKRRTALIDERREELERKVKNESLTTKPDDDCSRNY